VRVCFADSKSETELMAIPIAAPANAAPTDQTIVFSHAIAENVNALALVPEQVPPHIVLPPTAALPDGTRTPSIKLNTRADWFRRYWFAKPIALPRGSRIEIVA